MLCPRRRRRGINSPKASFALSESDTVVDQTPEPQSQSDDDTTVVEAQGRRTKSPLVEETEELAIELRIKGSGPTARIPANLKNVVNVFDVRDAGQLLAGTTHRYV